MGIFFTRLPSKIGMHVQEGQDGSLFLMIDIFWTEKKCVIQKKKTLNCRRQSVAFSNTDFVFFPNFSESMGKVYHWEKVYHIMKDYLDAGRQIACW